MNPVRTDVNKMLNDMIIIQRKELVLNEEVDAILDFFRKESSV
jgi:hypothetical protein